MYILMSSRPVPIVGQTLEGLHLEFAACGSCKSHMCDQRSANLRTGSVLMTGVCHAGRPHQIRIHMAAAGHPLVDDPLYTLGGVPKASAAGGEDGSGVGAMPGDCGYHLHSWRLAFAHPVTGGRVTVIAPPPAILQ